MRLRKETFDYFGKKINIEIYYSKMQGNDGLKKVFKMTILEIIKPKNINANKKIIINIIKSQI